MRKYIFITVNYNNSNFTESFIKSVNKIYLEENDNIEMIIVDNASKEDEVKKLEGICRKFSNVKLVKSQKNLGYFKGLNLGIKEVDEKDREDVIIGNNDLEFDMKFIMRLKEIKYKAKIMVISPNIITRDGKQQNPLAMKSISKLERIKNDIYYSNYYIAQIFRSINIFRKKIINTKDKLTNNYDQIIIKRGIGACYILTKNFFNSYDKLDDSVFMWGEEALLSNQVEKADGYILYDSKLMIKHYESASVSKMKSKKKYEIVRESYKIYREFL